MTEAERLNLVWAHPLGEVEKGCLLEITSVEKKTGEFSEYGLARYSTTLKGGERRCGVVRLNEDILQNAELKPHCVLLYDGMKVGGKQKKAFHDVSMLAAPTATADELLQFADGSAFVLPYSILCSL